jgi:hypothetical protein
MHRRCSSRFVQTGVENGLPVSQILHHGSCGLSRSLRNLRGFVYGNCGFELADALTSAWSRFCCGYVVALRRAKDPVTGGGRPSTVYLALFSSRSTLIASQFLVICSRHKFRYTCPLAVCVPYL